MKKSNEHKGALSSEQRKMVSDKIDHVMHSLSFSNRIGQHREMAENYTISESLQIEYLAKVVEIEMSWEAGERVRAKKQLRKLDFFREGLLRVSESIVEAGVKAIEGTSAGGRATANLRAGITSKVLEKMRSYIDANNSISNAARLTFERDGLGSSAGANRSLYYNHRKKL